MLSFKDYLNEIRLTNSKEHSPGTYVGKTSSLSGKKTSMNHEVEADSEHDAQQKMTALHRAQHKSHWEYPVHAHVAKKQPVRKAQYNDKDDPHDPEHRAEMQKRYDSLQYKGD